MIVLMCPRRVYVGVAFVLGFQSLVVIAYSANRAELALFDAHNRIICHGENLLSSVSKEGCKNAQCIVAASRPSFFGWFFYRGLAGDGGASVHSKLPCEDAVLLCSLPRSQTKPPSAVSVCCSLSGGSQHNCRRTGKISDFSFRRACCVTHYTLQTRWWARRSPLTP